MRLVVEDWLLSRWWLLALPLGALVAAAWKTGDLRLWMVVPVLTCLIFPLIMVYLYYSYALTPEAVAAIRPHYTLVSADGSITLVHAPEHDNEKRLPQLHLSAKSIASIEENASRRIVRIKQKPFRFIIIPNILPQDENL